MRIRLRCPDCHGTGDGNGNHEREWIKCRRCRGSGEITRASYPYKPRLFREHGEWKAVCNVRTPSEWMHAAHAHVKHLQGVT